MIIIVITLCITGGTFDITACQVKADGTLMEIAAANGGNAGGHKVNEAFWILLTEIFGSIQAECFRRENREDEFLLEKHFETKKKGISESTNSQSSENITFFIPVLYEMFKNEQGENTLPETIRKCKHAEYITLCKSKIRIKKVLIKKLFEKPCSEIVDRVADLLSQPALSNVDVIMMVGGFSDSDYLYAKMKEMVDTKSPITQVLRPKDAISAVLKGAVLFGNDPLIFSERICRFTYGIRIQRPFREEKDPKKFEMGGNCLNVFDKLNEIGTPISSIEFSSPKRYRPLFKNETEAKLEFYASKHRDPQYTTDVDCVHLGDVFVKRATTDRPLEEQTILVSIKVGDTCLVVKAVEEITGEDVLKEVKFLG